jgi:GTP-binding protein
LIEKDHRTADEFKKEIYERIAPMTYVPILFTSVLNKQRVFQSIQKAMEVYEARSQRIPTSALNDALLPEIERYPPPATKGKYIRIKYVTQLPTATPAFAFFCNLPQYIKEPYARYLENQIRKHFDFEGVPIQVFFRKK